jgi:hypothetical protein
VNDVYETLAPVTLNGLRFSVELVHDADMGPPWKEHDGHGVVSEWTARAKRPGERVLSRSDSGRLWLYDVQASMERARAEGWGICGERRAEWEARIGRALTPGMIAAAAVDEDFKRLRAWCREEWTWCGVIVTLLDVDGKPTGLCESLWGIESDGPEYHNEVARDLAYGLAHGLTGDTITEGARASSGCARRPNDREAHHVYAGVS